MVHHALCPIPYYRLCGLKVKVSMAHSALLELILKEVGLCFSSSVYNKKNTFFLYLNWQSKIWQYSVQSSQE